MNAAECLERAQDCERLADTMSGTNKDVLLGIARTWRKIAADEMRGVPPVPIPSSKPN
jgi:hypothetical protein